MTVAPARDIVLVGGGHAHVQVVGALALRDGLRVTLVSPSIKTPYSGMIPGVIAGLYEPDDAFIDLARVCALAGAHFVVGEACGLDRGAKHLLLTTGAHIAYDIVSFDIGSGPSVSAIPGAQAQAIAVKPIAGFLDRFDALRRASAAPDGPRHFVVIGGGAGGVELILAMRARLTAEASDPGALHFTLATGEALMPRHGARVRARIRAALARAGVDVRENARVVACDAGAVVCADGARIVADAIFVATPAAPRSLFANSGLDLDAGGFLAVGPTLQSTGDPDVFGAGDCVGLVASPRGKSGVMAVRAGPPLADNIYRRATGHQLKAWTPQRAQLNILATGDGSAIATRGPFVAEGEWVWRWKDRIDRRFMARFR